MKSNFQIESNRARRPRLFFRGILMPFYNIMSHFRGTKQSEGIKDRLLDPV